jgi:hypothetical protein
MRLKLITSVAAAVLGIGLLALPKAHASSDDWQCAIVLCLANPGGPTQYPACVPPMEKLESWLSNPSHGFPMCPGMNGEGVQKAVFDNVYIYQGPTGQRTALVEKSNGQLLVTTKAPWIDFPTQANP